MKQILKGNYNRSILVDAKLMVSKTYLIIAEYVAVNLVAQ